MRPAQPPDSIRGLEQPRAVRIRPARVRRSYGSLIAGAIGQATLFAIGLSGIACGSADPVVSRNEYFDLVAATGLQSPVEGVLISTEEGRRGLMLAPGAHLETAWFSNPNSVLRIARVAIRGGERLTIEIETEGAEPVSETVARDSRDLEIPLVPEGETPMRIRLQVSRPDPVRAEESSGIWLESPSVWGVAPPTEATPSLVAERQPTHPNVLIYLIDTLRRDRLGAYGYDRETSPEIDDFASTATLYTQAIAQSSWTKPSVASLLTGLWPTSHGATGWRHRLPEDAETLAEALKAEGYHTAAIVGNPNVVEAYGFDQGFDDFSRRLRHQSDQHHKLVLDWFEQYDSTQPFLLYVHTTDPHVPYKPREPYRERFAPDYHERPKSPVKWKWPIEALPFFSDAYDAEIAFNDQSFGRLIDYLRTQGLFDDTMIVLVSDHGEEFKEHNRWRHGSNLHRESLDVPLIVKYPRQSEGTVVQTKVQHVDILPTVLDWIGRQPAAGVHGNSLLALSASERSEPIVSHIDLRLDPQYSLVLGNWKLMRTHGVDGMTYQLFEIGGDPEELHDLSEDLPIRVAAMNAQLDLLLSDAGTPLAESEPAEVDQEMEDALRALGYLD